MNSPRQPLRQLRRALLVGSMFSACIGVLWLAIPIFALQLLQVALPAGSRDVLLAMTCAAALGLLVAAVLDYCRELMLLRAGLWIDHTLGASLLETGLARGAEGDELEAHAEAIATLRTVMSRGPLCALLDLPWAIAACGLITFLHPVLALTCAAAVAALLVALLMLQLASSRSGPADTASQRWLSTVARHAPHLALDGSAAGVALKWEHLNRRRISEGYRAGRRHGLARAVTRMLAASGLLAVFAVGGTLVITDALPPVAVVVAVLVAARALAALERTIADWDLIRDLSRAWRTLAEAARAPSVTTRFPVSAAATGRIEFSAASFSYPRSPHPALRDVTFTIEPGECIGIIGPSGSGKSALAAAVAGAMTPSSGRADLDGHPIAAVRRDPHHRLAGFMPDEPRLVAGTVGENIAGFERRSDANVASAAIRAGVHETLLSLPNGYETHVGDDGAALSWRARRAVALARALYGSPRIVVLDEPELGLDEAALDRLASALEGLQRDSVGLVIATASPRLLRLTDRIVLLSNGTIEGVLPSHQVTGVVASAANRKATLTQLSDLRQVA